MRREWNRIIGQYRFHRYHSPRLAVQDFARSLRDAWNELALRVYA